MKRPDGSWDTFEDYVLDFAIERMRAGERVAIVTLVEIEGASPRPLGAQMAVSETGFWVGYLSGGCIERAIAAEAVDALAAGRSRRVRYGRGARYIDISLPCGSAIELVFDVSVSLAEIEAIDACVRRRQNATMEVALSGPLLEGGAGEGQSLTRLYRPRRKLMIFGLGPVPALLARVAAASAFDVVLHTPDEATASAVHGHAVTIGPVDALQAPENVDDRTAVVIAYHDHDREEHLLPAALATDAFYIGAMGSRATQERRMELLSYKGFSRRQRERIHGPAGLLPHARSASDLALSILAQVVDAARREEESVVLDKALPVSAPRERSRHETSAETRL